MMINEGKDLLDCIVPWLNEQSDNSVRLLTEYGSMLFGTEDDHVVCELDYYGFYQKRRIYAMWTIEYGLMLCLQHHGYCNVFIPFHDIYKASFRRYTNRFAPSRLDSRIYDLMKTLNEGDSKHHDKHTASE